MSIAAALQLHLAGNLVEAERRYQEILAASPAHSDALHLLGVVAFQTQRHELAVECITRAIAINPGCGLYHNSLGAAHRSLGQLETAAQSFRSAVVIDPAHFEARYNLGVTLADQGQLEAAAREYVSALKLQPKHGQTLNNYGGLLQRQGEIDAAIANFQAALDVDPEFADARCNLGHARQLQGRWDAAIACYRTALRSRPEHPDTFYNLGLALQAADQRQEAGDCYREAIRLQPHFAAAHNNLGVLRRESGDLPGALACYRQSLQVDPRQAYVHKNLSALYQQLGERELAISALEDALRIQPGDVEAEHMLLALRGENPDAPSPAFVAAHFDRHANLYDEHLVRKLEYRIPGLLRTALERVCTPPRRGWKILDVGCGTGLGGLEFREMATHLAGIDLSPRMIDLAAQRGIYDNLEVAEMVAALDRLRQPVDLVLATDVFAYLGKLDSAIAAVHSALRPSGRLCFSTETSTHAGYSLRSTGRYTHAPQYVVSLAQEAGFELEHRTETTGRTEAGQPVSCQLFVFRKAA